jgi:hypothetical protein
MKKQIGVQYNIRSDINLKVAGRKKLEIKFPVSFLRGAAHLSKSFFFFLEPVWFFLNEQQK